LEIIKKTVKGSPYIGVFTIITNEIGLFPVDTSDEDIAEIEKLLKIRIIKSTLANCSLNGVLSTGIGKKIAITGMATETEIAKLENEGLEVKAVPHVTAIGNLIALNKNGGVASPILSNKTLELLQDFFEISIEKLKIADNEVPGASITTTNKGFIAHPNIKDKDYERLKKIFNVYGTTTTANYGDPFVGNSVIANDTAVIVGAQTSGHELIRIDEGLRGSEL